VLERLEASIAAGDARPARRRAASWLVVGGLAVASGVIAVLAWPGPARVSIRGDAPVSSAVDRARGYGSGRAPHRRTPTATHSPVVDEPPPPRLQPTPRPPLKRTPPASALAEDTLGVELALLRRARRALERDDYASASAALVEHGRSFAFGQLAEDRDALWVVLRCRNRAKNTGRAAFEAAHPSSHHLVAIEASCGD